MMLFAQNRQSGYVLLVVLVFLAILLSAGAHFYIRSTEHAKDSGGIRDITESMILAESALYRAMGFYLSGNYDDAGIAIPNNMNNQADMDDVLGNIPSLFYVTNTDTALDEVDQTDPSILQMVANGEAANIAYDQRTTQRLVTSAADPLTQLRINDLFNNGAGFRPELYVINPADGLLALSAALDWESEPSPVKAAVWFEVVENPAVADAVNIYVQAVAEVDGSKSYLQRVMIGYDPSFLLGEELAALSESSTPAEAGGIDRMRSADR